MLHTRSLYQVCDDLFTTYPLAVKTASRDGTIRTMVLTSRDGDYGRYFMLLQDYRDGRPLYSLRPWRATEAVNIEASGGATIPNIAVNVVTNGVPVPRHGSLFGWVGGETITALVPSYTRYTPANPEPSWTVMPRVGVSEIEWPPFTETHIFGQWFWEHYRDGGVVFLGNLIAQTPETVFWMDTEAVLGSECCAVAHNIDSPDGYTLSRGRYVHFEVVRTGKSIPSLGMLLANFSKTDLATRFRQS